MKTPAGIRFLQITVREDDVAVANRNVRAGNSYGNLGLARRLPSRSQDNPVYVLSLGQFEVERDIAFADLHVSREGRLIAIRFDANHVHRSGNRITNPILAVDADNTLPSLPVPLLWTRMSAGNDSNFFDGPLRFVIDDVAGNYESRAIAFRDRL